MTVQEFDGDRSLGIIGVAEHTRVSDRRGPLIAMGSTVICQLLGVSNIARTAFCRRGTLEYVTQAFSPILHSAVRTAERKEIVYVAAVERGSTSRPGTGRGVLKPRLPIALVEPRYRGVDVRLVEDLTAGDQATFDRQDVDRPPLGREPLSRGPLPCPRHNRSTGTQPMHRFDVDAEMRREVPPDTK